MNTSAPPPNQPPTTPLSVANHARHTARHTRAEWLAAIYHQMVTIDTLLTEASSHPNHPLRKIRLTQLLQTQPDWGSARTTETLRNLVTYIGRPDLNINELTVSWLIKRSSRGKRLTAWTDVTHQQIRSQPPWDGFPWSAPPEPAELTAHQYKLVHARSRTR